MPLQSWKGGAELGTVWKEDLVVVDEDLWTDYPPESFLPIPLPSTVKIVHARGIPHEEFTLVLRRAKVAHLLASSASW